MYCPKCGKEIGRESSFCMFCGVSVQEFSAPGAAADDKTELLAAESGRYQQMAMIGMGGMGHVYKAYDSVMEEWIALKTLPPELHHDPKLMAMFIREARHTRKLAHPNIIRVHDVVEIGKTSYISMEYVDGGDLKKLISQQGALKLDLIMKLLSQIAAALYYSHNQNIVHRDLKPQNILLTGDLQVKISDFGIAKALDDTGVTKSGALGTPIYVSPEHLGHGSIDNRSDIYSLGIILYEMITGDVPFKADTPWVLFNLHLTEAPPSPLALRPDTPLVMAEAVMKCLAKPPDERFQNARDLIAFFRASRGPAPSASAPGPKAPPAQAASEESLETMDADNVANTVGMTLKLVAPGEFMMGSDRGGDDERSVHRVAITYPFYMSVHPVTQEQYKALTGVDPARCVGGRNPVEDVSWNEARKYCQLLSERENAAYRLPSEAEWEFAARAGTSGEYFWGDKFNPAFASSMSNSGGAPREVGLLRPNPWGLFDMCGNVWEWCEDFYAGAYPAQFHANPAGPRAGAERVLRGGAFDSDPALCRSAARDKLRPQDRRPNAGFRVVRDYECKRRMGKLMVRLAHGNLAQRKADAVVNSTTRALSLTGSVSRALLVAGGPDIQKEVRQYQGLALGAVLKTGAGRLPARAIYHVAVNEKDAPPIFGEAVANLLVQAMGDRAELVAMPLIGMGIPGVELEAALGMVMEALFAQSRMVDLELAIDLVIFDRRTYHNLMQGFLKYRPKTNAAS